MLRQAGRLLLPHGALCQAVTSSQQLLQQANPWLQQSRSISDGTETFDTGSRLVDTALDAVPAAELIDHADTLMSVSQVANEAAILAAKAECFWFGPRKFIDLLTWSHDGLNLPWFEAIAVSNLVLKLCLVPLAVITQREAPKMVAMRSETEQLKQMSLKLSQAKSAYEYNKCLNEYKAAMDDFRQRNKGSMTKSILLPALTLVQTGVFIAQFGAVSTLASAKIPAMTYEGALWVKDLTISDPYFGMPIICSLATLAMLRSASFREQMAATGPASDFMKKLMTGVAVMMIPLGSYTTSAVAILWASNALMTYAQNVALSTPSVRRALGMPVKGEQPAATTGPSWFEKVYNNLTGRRQRKAPAPAAAADRVLSPVSAINYLPLKPRRKTAKVPPPPGTRPTL